MNLKPILISISIFILCSTSAHAQLRADEYFRIGIGADIGYTTFYLSENSYSNKSWAETKVSFVQLQSRGRKVFYSTRLMYQQSSVNFSSDYTTYEYSDGGLWHKEGIRWKYAEAYHTLGILARLHIQLLKPNTRIQLSTGIGSSIEKAINHEVYDDEFSIYSHTAFVGQYPTYSDSTISATSRLRINNSGLIFGLDFFMNTRVAINRRIAITLEGALRPYLRPYLSTVKKNKILGFWYCGFHLDYSLWPPTK